MSFASIFALLIGALVLAPVVAHLLRRRRTEVRAFPPALLVPAAPPLARRRARLEDRGLFVLRALAVIALAVLGSAPFIRCSKLNLGRRGGGSMAVLLVVDDSMSMRAKLGNKTRLARAVEGAREVLSSLREGDAVAIVSAGAPARVVLATTADLNAASRALDAVQETDRATDLDGALALASSLAASLPQPDRRIVVLSDLADGKTTPLGRDTAVPIWIPLAELRQASKNCGVVRALRRGRDVKVRVVCGVPDDAVARSITLRSGQDVVASVTLAREAAQEIDLTLPEASTSASVVARLTGSDALAADDSAPVVAAGGALQVAVVSDLAQSAVVTGGASPVETALSAIDDTLAVRPLPSIPDNAEELASYGAVVLDDPPGLTPESRTAFKTYLERGGTACLLLGPRAAGAILGAAFDPFVPGPVRWASPAPPGADPASMATLGASGEGLLELAPRGRATLDEKAEGNATVLARWSDGRPLAFTRVVGRGSAIVATLPGSVETSDFPLRPAFLEILSRVIDGGRSRAVGRRSLVGVPWVFRDTLPTAAVGPEGNVRFRDEGGARTVVPTLAGLYLVKFGEDAFETRVAEIDEREIDLTPRPLAPEAASSAVGSREASIDASPYIAMVLLLTIAGEAALRLFLRRRAQAEAEVA